MEKLEKQKCPICHKDSLSLIELAKEVPYFGIVHIFSMDCSECNYHMADVEAAEEKEPARYTLEINSEKDMNIRIVKSSTALVKIPELKMSVEPGMASNGYVTNVEGILERFKKILENERDTTEDDDVKKKSKNLLKKIWKIKLGEMPVKIILEDKSGNSAIISEKAKVEKIKK